MTEQPADPAAAQLAAQLALAGVFACKWSPSTTYALGDVVQSPAGVLVQAIAGHVSGLAYESTNWGNVPAGDIVIGAYPLELGLADNTAALIAAITAATKTTADRRAVSLEGRELVTAGITLGPYSKIGWGVLTRASGATGPVLSLPSQGAFQAPDRSMVERLRVNGVSKDAGSVGIAIGNHASLVMRDVSVQDADTGFRLRGTQFCDFYSLKTTNCRIGLDSASIAGAGGTNSNYFASYQAAEPIIGALFKNTNPPGRSDTPAPVHSIELVSPQIIGSKLCALAAVGVQNLNVRGWAGEYNGQGAEESVVVRGDRIRRSSVFLSGSSVLMDGGYIAEATVSPVFIAENDSHLTLNNVSGYGLITGTLVECDASSGVSLTGRYGCIGVVHGVTRIDVDLTAASCGIQGPPETHSTTGLPNAVDDPQAPGFTDTLGATAGAGRDDLYGAYDSATFPAEPSGRILKAMTLGPATLVAITVRASVDTSLEFKFLINVGNKVIRMRAGEWARIFWFDATSTGEQNFMISPQDAAGATVDVCRWQVVTGTDGPALRRQINSALRGGWTG